MTSTHGFTSAATVKLRISNFNPGVSDGNIETYINHAEGLVIAVSRVKWIATGSSTIPLLIERVTTDLAALHLLANDPSGFSSLAEAAFIADVLWASSRRDLLYLGDERVIKKLKEDTSN